MLPERVQLTLQLHADLDVMKGADQQAANWTEDAEEVEEVEEVLPQSRWRRARHLTEKRASRQLALPRVKHCLATGFRLQWAGSMACLHVYNISGTTVLELDGEERKRLRCATHFGLALKETIQRLTGTPRFRQRLFFCGHEVLGESPLPDTERMELQLVILPLRQEKSPALIHAAKLGDLTSLTSLLEDGQDPNATNGHFSPLWAAACHGRLKVAKLLLQARADMEIADVEEQRSPLLIAADHGHWDVLHHLLEERANVNHVDSRQRTPLFQAALMGGQGAHAAVKALIEADAKLESVDAAEIPSPLCVAAETGHLQVMQLLVQAGAKKNQPGPEGRTPLWCAAASRHLLCVRWLLREKADPELGDLEGMTPLSVAAAHGRVDVARALLTGRADVKTVDHQGRSALWTLARR
eukprot:s3344_g6.t1